MENAKSQVVEVVASWGESRLDSAVVSEGALVIGPSAGGWLTLPSEVLARDVALVERTEEGFVLVCPAGAELRLGEGLTAVAFGGERRVRLTPGASAEIHLGAFRFFVRMSEPVTDALPRAIGSVRWTRWLAITAILHALVLGMFALSPPNVSALNADNIHAQSRYLTLALPAVATPPPPVLPPVAAGGSSSDSAGSEGGGEAAVPQESGSPGERRPAGARQPRPSPSFVVTPDQVNRLGILAVLTSEAMSFGDGSSPFIVGSGVDGDGGLAENSQLLALPRGPNYGALDMGGTGVGTCDPRRENCDRGLIDVGPLGTRPSRGPGPEGALRGRPDGAVPNPPTPPPTTITNGGLSREEVRRTIRRHVNEVRFCYEQGLQTRPDLEGRVAVQFIITQDGRVGNVGLASNDVSPAVGQCVAGAVARWTFPSSEMPTGVTYPFVLQSGR